jgi:hypothetical protein
MKTKLAGIATVVRGNEAVPFSSPEISISMGMQEEPAYIVLNDDVGAHDIAPYRQHGKIYKQSVRIRITVKEPADGGVNDVRESIKAVEAAMKNVIRKDWEYILKANNACLNKRGDFVERDTSFMKEKQKFLSKTYILSILKMDKWNFVPTDENDRDTIAEEAEVIFEAG